MTGRERLTAILNKDEVDRPGLNFYEVGGLPIDPDDRDPFNTYGSSSWRELLDLTEKHTDIIRMRQAEKIADSPLYHDFFSKENYEEKGRRYVKTTLRIGGRTLTSLTRQDKDVNTVWILEHLLKSKEDLELFLTIPDEVFEGRYGTAELFEEERRTGDKGLVMVETGDPLCEAAGLFDFQDYAVIAMTEQALFHRLLEKLSRAIYMRTEQISSDFSGRLWRIYGPEYASEPYLPPYLFKEYVQRYTEPMVKSIQANGGYVRLHSHGRLKKILPIISGMNVDAIDPIEPPPQGDVELEYVVEHYGKDIVLFGNVEVTDIENMDPRDFERKTAKSIEAGCKAGGFVLMPSSSPFGRDVSERVLTNYKTMIRLVKGVDIY